jgi:hypothetical protein
MAVLFCSKRDDLASFACAELRVIVSRPLSYLSRRNQGRPKQSLLRMAPDLIISQLAESLGCATVGQPSWLWPRPW